MKQSKNIHKAALLTFMYGALFVFLALTNPRELHPVLLIAPVLWLFGALFFTFKSLIGLVSYSSDGQAQASATARSLVLAGSISALLLLQSINQLTAKDILLLLLFGTIALLYVRRFRLAQKRD